AALHVITQEDIRRSGATSIPEVLRLAPGVQVARINGGVWSIGIRGFADRLARSMLVLIDGRAVYSPLFAGTYWEVQDTLLEDIERIEVIRGPGGTLWGANAVDGIINIITKAAKDTAGVLAQGGVGFSDQGLGVRYGGTAGASWNYRVYGKMSDRASQFHPADLDYDGLRMGQGGFRADWTPDARTFTIQGDIYKASLGQRPTVTTYVSPFARTSNMDTPLSGANVLARWTAPLAERSTVQLQTFYARTNRDEVPVKENRDTFDLDFQHTLGQWPRHQLVWGLGYRATSGRITSIAPTEFVPPRRTDNLYSGFVQDEIAVIPDRLRATFGSKIEHNDYSGVEVQPSARLLWTPAPDHTWWWSVARAVRTPSQVETDYTTAGLINPAIPLFVRLEPNPAFTSEELVALEVGYRTRPVAPAYITLSGFYNQHDDVLSTEIFPTFAEPLPTLVRLVIPVTFANGLHGNSYGAEVTSDVRPTTWWRWTANYSYLRIQLSKQPGSLDGSQERRNEGLSPRHQVEVRSSIDLPRRWSFDAFFRYVSELPAGPVPGYGTTNVRVAWQATPRVEVAVVGQDLNEAHHLEWPSGSGGNVEIQRSGYVSVTWRPR
ncbi:MAG: TonB-dependent receptor, partial [Acidobacteria bacterium]